jgi:2-methylcitrate dehydratase PrpD
MAEDAADITVTTRDGRTLHQRIEHAIGSLEHPMSDADLARKFHGLVDPVLGASASEALVGLCMELPRAADVRTLVAAAQPARR